MVPDTAAHSQTPPQDIPISSNDVASVKPEPGNGVFISTGCVTQRLVANQNGQLALSLQLLRPMALNFHLPKPTNLALMSAVHAAGHLQD